MSLTIKGILTESKEYYIKLKKQLAGQLLTNAKGSLRRQIVKGQTYVYLRYKSHKNPNERYIGIENSWIASIISESLKKESWQFPKYEKQSLR